MAVQDLFKSLFSKESSTFTPELLVQALNKVAQEMFDTSGDSTLSFLGDTAGLPTSRADRLKNYRVMEAESLEVHRALNIYADIVTQPLASDRCFEYKSDDKTLADELNEMALRLDLDEILWGAARTMARDGSIFSLIDSKEGEGVNGLNSIDGEHVTIEKDDRGVFFQREKLRLEVYQVAFSRLPYYGSSTANANVGDLQKYGNSMMEGLRDTWRKLKLVETAVIVHRVSRATPRRIYSVDVGTQDIATALDTLKKFARSLKYRKQITQDSFRKILDPMAVTEDIFIPMSDESKSTFAEFSGSSDVAAVEDVNRFRDKLHMGLEIPVEYMNLGAPGVKDYSGTILTQKDLHFSRTMKRLQRAVARYLIYIGKVHLFRKYGAASQLDKFGVKLAPISRLEEMIRLDNLSLAVSTALSLVDIPEKFGMDETMKTKWINFVFATVLSPVDDTLAELFKLAPAVEGDLTTKFVNALEYFDKVKAQGVKEGTREAYYESSSFFIDGMDVRV
jgi:hypothetical protein